MTLQPSLGAVWVGRHFVYFKLPWAQATARLFGLRLVGRLYRRWAPGWRGPVRDASVAAAVEAFGDERVVRGALSYYKALRPGHPLYRAKIGRRGTSPPPARYASSRAPATGRTARTKRRSSKHCWPSWRLSGRPTPPVSATRSPLDAPHCLTSAPRRPSLEHRRQDRRPAAPAAPVRCGHVSAIWPTTPHGEPVPAHRCAARKRAWR